MKKQYIKPSMQVTELRQQLLLTNSQKNVPVYNDDPITSEIDVW